MRNVIGFSLLILIGITFILPVKVSASVIVYDSQTGFSDIQGANNWYYIDSRGKYLLFDANRNGWYSSDDPYLLLWSWGGHPGSNADAVRQWVVPHDGSMYVRGVVSDADGGGGDGVVVSVKKRTLKNPKKLKTLFKRTIKNGSLDGVSFFATTRVAAGDQINFIINRRKNNFFDSTAFVATVEFTPDKAVDAGLPIPPVNPSMGWVLIDAVYYIDENSNQIFGNTLRDSAIESKILGTKDPKKYVVFCPQPTVRCDWNDPATYEVMELPEEISVVSLETTWYNIERFPGVFDWSAIDQAVEFWKSKGRKIGFRLSTDTFPNWLARSAFHGTPAWMYCEQGRIQNCVKNYTEIKGFKYPDYGDANYRTLLVRFLNAFATRYHGESALEMVDLRGYGEWGEWHSGGSFAYDASGRPVRYELAAREESLKWLIEVWRTVWPENVRLLLSGSYELAETVDNNPGLVLHTEAADDQIVDNTDFYSDFLRVSALDYALNQNIDFYRDGVAGCLRTNDLALMENSFVALGRKTIIRSELCGGYQGYATDKRWGYNIEEAVLELLQLHPNYITLPGWDLTSDIPEIPRNGASHFIKEERKLLRLAYQRMGYWISILGASVADTAFSGGILPISLRLQNEGVGRIPNGYKLTYRLTSGEQVIKITDFANDPSMLINPQKIKSLQNYSPKIYEITSTLNLPSINTGIYALSLSLEDQNGKQIYFATDLGGKEGHPTVIDIGRVNIQ